MSSTGHDDVAYYEGVADEMRRLLDENPEPSEWSDAAKLRLLAGLFDQADLMRGVLDQHQVQDDLRRIADKLDE